MTEYKVELAEDGRGHWTATLYDGDEEVWESWEVSDSFFYGGRIVDRETALGRAKKEAERRAKLRIVHREEVVLTVDP